MPSTKGEVCIFFAEKHGVISVRIHNMTFHVPASQYLHKDAERSSDI